MFFGISHVELPVTSLERAARFWTTGIGFVERQRGEGFIDIDAGNVTVRLAHGRTTTTAALRMVVADPAAASAAFAAAGGTVLYAAERAGLELQATCLDPDGNRVVLFRELSEDEYAEPVDLPTTTSWRPEARELLLGLLRHVPALFRALARRRITKNAEHIAQNEGVARIDERTVVRAYIVSNSKATRERVRAPLHAYGYDVNDFLDDFNS